MKFVFSTTLYLLIQFCLIESTALGQNPGDKQNRVIQVQDSCNQSLNQEKYNHYRFRFRGNQSPEYPGFVREGTQIGNSLPVDALMPYTDCYWDYVLNVRECNVADSSGPIGNIRFSDASQDLGYYIGVLATEFELNRIYELPQDELIKELWMALKAFDRLDSGAEALYDHPPQLDGFFLRDDIEGDFHLDPITGAHLFPHPMRTVPGYQCLSSALSCGANTVDDGTFCSQDQMIYVMTGLALVDRFIPENVVYNRDTLLHMARHDVHRMVKHLRDNSWTIRAPDGTTPPDQYGGSAQGFSFKFAELADLITNNRYFGPTYHDNFSENGGAALWFFVEEFFSSQQVINQAMILTLSAITHTWDAQEMVDKSLEADMGVFALMQSVIHNEALGNSNIISDLQNLVDIAPYKGTCSGTPNCEEVPRWKTSNRWLHPDLSNGDPNMEPAQFNGLDFMILYNLNEIYKNQQSLEVEFEPCPEEPEVSAPISPLDETLIYPNPSEDKLTIEFYAKTDGQIKVELIDALGKRVYSEIRNPDGKENLYFQWDISRFNSGIYWVRIHQDEEYRSYPIHKR